ncbi:MAG: hypothetical protein NTZ05_15485, partial [Chloroflexi bacterium]|nr:hypothetical protein [Chloroflexota bacterium]
VCAGCFVFFAWDAISHYRAGGSILLPLCGLMAALLPVVLIGGLLNVLLFGWGLSKPAETVEFSQASTADTIVIRIRGRQTKSVTDSDTIREMARLLQRYQGTWEYPRPEMPAPQGDLEFTARGVSVDRVRFARGYFGQWLITTGFVVRPVAKPELDQLLAPLGLTHQDLH